jgi:hypothetical protein
MASTWDVLLSWILTGTPHFQSKRDSKTGLTGSSRDSISFRCSHLDSLFPNSDPLFLSPYLARGRIPNGLRQWKDFLPLPRGGVRWGQGWGIRDEKKVAFRSQRSGLEAPVRSWLDPFQ